MVTESTSQEFKNLIRKLAFVAPFDCHINLKGKMDMPVGFVAKYSVQLITTTHFNPLHSVTTIS